MNAIKPAIFPEDLERVITIFREYVASPSVNLDFQDYESEFAALPGKYAAPEGRLLLAWKNGGRWWGAPHCAKWMPASAK